MSMSWSARAARRRVYGFLAPAEDVRIHRRWYVVDTPEGLRRLQWRPGIEVWRGERGERITSEAAHELGWVIVKVSPDQTGDPT